MASRGNVTTATVDDELNQLEKDIRQLKIEYEQYFGGGRKRPPADTQWRVETLVKRYSERIGQLKFAQRFRFNNLASTYAKYQDMWRKKLAQKEAGTQQRHFGAAAKAIEAERAREHTTSEAGHGPGGARTGSSRRTAGSARHSNPVSVFSVALEDPDLEEEKLVVLYRKLIELRKETGESAGAPSLSDFESFVRRKTQELRSKGAYAVEYTVSIENGRVKLKARTSA